MDRIRGATAKPVYAINPSRVINILDGGGVSTHGLTFINGVLSSYSGGGPMMNLSQYLLDDSGEVIEGFESAAEWTPTGATVANDAVNFTQGLQSILLTTFGGVHYALKNTGYNLNGKQAFCRIDLRSNTFNIRPLWVIGKAGFSKYFSYQVPLTQTCIIGWDTYQIPVAEWTVGGGMAWTDNIELQQMYYPAAAQINYDNFRANVIPQTGAVLLYFDGNYDGQYQYAFASMQARHMLGTVFTVTDWINTANHMTSAQMQGMYAAGWDFGLHSKNAAHYNAMTQAQIETDIINSKAAIDALGLTRANRHHCLPYGETDADIVAAFTAQGVLTARSIDGGTFVLPILTPYHTRSYPLNPAISLATAKTYIDSAVNGKKVVSVFVHDIVAAGPGGGEWTSADLDGLLDYIVTSGLPVLTISQLWDLHSGPITVAMPY